MTFDSEKTLDGVSWKLLVLLQEDARRSYSELGRNVGLSAPAVAERIRRLEEAGIITGYHAAVNPAKLGLPIAAVLRLSGVSDRMPQLTEIVLATPEVLECHRLTGSDSYVMRVVAASIGHLERLIDRFVPFGEVNTSLVLSSPVMVRVIQEP